MSELAVRERLRKQSWAAPGGSHDVMVRVLKLVLPAVIGMLLAYLALVPLSKTREISFILDKTKVDVARERMRVQAARYRGQDNKGRPFTIDARSAVQATSSDPIVDVLGMSAQIGLESGPATFQANRGRYNLETETIDVVGPILLTAADGYRLETRDVTVDLNSRTMASRGRVDGKMPLGRFSADRLLADLPARQVTLAGNARLHIVQGGIR
ncbi:LPS export ABC transporter periplasmic protein LptC [Sphingomonas sp. LY54]|uniref:LPS export ABC transporter periplasmic protein LptC n=1 Tax=Sphingomonas sp. LY54 TaxID=3095343 RepID=UPI002D78F76C|nr:LPS export ABC transporter periplasmic protein LptC [Sphingomonas sp. LY54]WRP28101.1 LPS export ABC transporter periplasmic protein LptC [Sphingomonas sp. LY54]